MIGGNCFAQAGLTSAAGSEQYSIPLISADQMIAGDRKVATGWQQAIAGSARFYGYALDSSYNYRQIACPVAPDHLILAYEAMAPNGSLSRFTAVIRRGTEEEAAGRYASAQIIPILHAGVVPFVPAIANPHSIEVFNGAVSPAPEVTQVLEAARKGSQPLLLRSLCYLAMVGEEPAALGPSSEDQPAIRAPVPTLGFVKRGQIRQTISIRGPGNDYQVWTLNFVSGGKLLSATRAAHPIDRTPFVLNAEAAVPGPSAAPDHKQPVTDAGATASAPSMPPVPAPAAVRPSMPAAVASAPAAPVVPGTPAPEPATAPTPQTITAESSQPLSTPALPKAPTARAPVATAEGVTPAVNPGPPEPRSRFYTNLPLPRSKFIPESTLKTPPHLPQ